jgi:hypothetical protein
MLRDMESSTSLFLKCWSEYRRCRGAGLRRHGYRSNPPVEESYAAARIAASHE